MIEWLTVILLVIFGIILIVLELVFIPGTTFVGLLGLGLSITGIVLSFDYFGTEVGWIVLLITSFVSITSLIYSLRSGVWERFANKSAILSKFNEAFKPDLKEGDVGVTISALRPIGKAEFNDKVFEVKTNGDYLEAGNKVKVIHIDDNRIIVELFNNI